MQTAQLIFLLLTLLAVVGIVLLPLRLARARLSRQVPPRLHRIDAAGCMSFIHERGRQSLYFADALPSRAPPARPNALPTFSQQTQHPSRTGDRNLTGRLVLLRACLRDVYARVL